MTRKLLSTRKVYIIIAAVVLLVCTSLLLPKFTSQEDIVYAATKDASLIDYTVVVKDEHNALLGTFLTVSNISSVTDVIEYQDGEDRILRKRPGMTRYPNVILERALSTENDAMWAWRQTILMGKPERHSLSIEIYSKKDLNTPLVKYILEYCWPSKVILPELRSDSKGIPIEQWEIACESFQRVVP
ncbi:MAG: phage tail protein [Dehalococcoidales bacterium]|nr:phage tail protein [Dehalococcoidales bacterium]